MYEKEKSQKNYKKKMFILIAILLAGFLIQSVMYLLISRFFTFPISGGSSGRADIELMEFRKTINMRFRLRDFGERTCGIAAFIFVVGSVSLLGSFIKNGRPVAFGPLFLLFFGTVAGMVACTMPFALTDRASWGNYFFMMRGVLPIMAVLFVILLGANLVKMRN